MPDGAYEIETWPLVAAVPGVQGPFDDADDFRRRALAYEPRRMRVYAMPDRHRLRIALPEEYAAALDATRPLRAVLAGEPAGPATPGTIVDPALLARALPEDVAALLALGPPPWFVDAVVLLDEANPADAWHRQSTGDGGFVSAASASRGVITLYRAEHGPRLREQLFHELAHLLGEAYESDWHWFAIAADVEADGYAHRARATLGLAESWAVHLGECVLGSDDDAFTRFCEEAPVRAAVLGRVLARLVDDGPDAWHDAGAMRRADHLATVVRDVAMACLRAALLPTAGTPGADTPAPDDPRLHLLLALADGAPVPGFESCTRLDLAGTPLTSRVLASLASFSSLEDLGLAGLLLGRGSLASLPALAGLRRLDLHGTRVWSSDLGNVSGLRSLAWLDVGETNVNESALPTLGRLTALRYLRISGTALASCAAALRTVLPACEVVA